MDDAARSVEFQIEGGELEQQERGEAEGAIDPNSDEALVRALEEQRRAPRDVHAAPLSPADNPPMRLVLGFLSSMDLLAAVSAELEGIPVASAREVLDAAHGLWRTPIREAFGALRRPTSSLHSSALLALPARPPQRRVSSNGAPGC